MDDPAGSSNNGSLTTCVGEAYPVTAEITRGRCFLALVFGHNMKRRYRQNA